MELECRKMYYKLPNIMYTMQIISHVTESAVVSYIVEEALSEVRARIVSVPEWWKDSGDAW